MTTNEPTGPLPVPETQATPADTTQAPPADTTEATPADATEATPAATSPGPTGAASGPGQSGEGGATAAVAYVRGPNLAAIFIGLVAIVAGGAAIGQALTGLVVDWERAGPLLVGAFGVLLVAAGLGGMMRRRRDSAGQPAR